MMQCSCCAYYADVGHNYLRRDVTVTEKTIINND